MVECVACAMVRKQLSRWSEKQIKKGVERLHAVYVSGSPADPQSDMPIADAPEDVEMPAFGDGQLVATGSGDGAPSAALRTGLHSGGVSFEIPKGRKFSEGIQQALRKVHCNLGHPSKADLERSLKLGGAKQEVLEAVSWEVCVVCP